MYFRKCLAFRKTDTLLSSRATITIFETVFKVKVRAEDLNLRIAERSLRQSVEKSQKKEKREGWFVILLVEKMEEEGYSFFQPRRSKIERTSNELFSHIRRTWPYLSNLRSEHTAGASEQGGARRNGEERRTDQNETPKNRFAQQISVSDTSQGINNNYSERLFSKH